MKILITSIVRPEESSDQIHRLQSRNSENLASKIQQY